MIARPTHKETIRVMTVSQKTNKPQNKLTLQWRMVLPLPGFPCSTPPRTPGWGTAGSPQRCRPSGRGSSPDPQQLPVGLETGQRNSLHATHSKLAMVTTESTHKGVN